MSDETANPEATVDEEFDDLVDDMVRQLNSARENGGDERDVVHRVLKGALDEVAKHDERRAEVEGMLHEFLMGIAKAAVLWKPRVTGGELLARIAELRERETTLIDFVHSLHSLNLSDEGRERFEKIKLWAYPIAQEKDPRE